MKKKKKGREKKRHGRMARMRTPTLKPYQCTVSEARMEQRSWSMNGIQLFKFECNKKIKNSIEF